MHVPFAFAAVGRYNSSAVCTAEYSLLVSSKHGSAREKAEGYNCIVLLVRKGTEKLPAREGGRTPNYHSKLQKCKLHVGSEAAAATLKITRVHIHRWSTESKRFAHQMHHLLVREGEEE